MANKEEEKDPDRKEEEVAGTDAEPVEGQENNKRQSSKSFGSVKSVQPGTSTKSPDNENELAEEEDQRDSGSEDGFADAQESSSPPKPRSLTQLSHSTMSSNPEMLPLDTTAGSSSTDKRNSQLSITPTTTNNSVHENGAMPSKSPLSQRRISTTSLDEVSLMDELPPLKEPPVMNDSNSATSTSSNSIVESITNRFSRSSTTSTQTTASVSKTPPAPPSLPPRKLSDPTPPPATPPAAVQPPPPPPPTVRRSPFSWLQRNTTASPATPTAQSRRATASSIATSGSLTTPGNSELLLNRLESNRNSTSEKDEASRGSENLRENFRKIREAREHARASSEGTVSGKGSVFSGLISSGAGFLPGQSNPTPTPPAQEDSVSPLASPKSQPATQEEVIDWDLWQSVVDDALKVATEKPTELNRAIQAGIPPTLRGTVWQSMAASKSLEFETIYREIVALPSNATAEDARPIFGSHWLWDPLPTCSQSSSPRSGSMASPRLEAYGANNNGLGDKGWGKTVAQLEKVIKKDLGDRTSFAKYKVDQKALMGVCKAYALFDPDVGYTQGMAFIATVLLLNMTEEEAFCIFVKLMNKYKLRSMFQEKMKGLELRLHQYDRILEDYEPRLAVHLKRQGIEASLYAAQWFLTLFTYKFPLQLVLRVFDLLFSEGLEGPVLKFGIVLMKKNACSLTEMEFEMLAPFLKERLFDVYLDATPSASSVKEAGFFGNGGEKEVYRANMMVQDACSIKITQEMLDRYEREWEEDQRIKRETETELETLRRTNTSLMSKVKKLEQQNEELNTEYVRMASSEVGLKVQNDQLADENEVLKAKVDGLRDMVDKQPQEVEDRLKDEMEVLMKRNLEVHTENQGLEESMLEMEKELVSTKMQLATVNEDYDLLKNRWNDLKKALGD